ncbi:MAG: STAS domain-containing protein [Deltaproteobacteria bacterium]|nr:STAS domain-containing protein [Deltaproteobacteria bacterium]
MVEVKQEFRGKTVLLSLRGELTVSSRHQLNQLVQELVDGNHVRVIVDLHELTLIDSAGVAVLVSLFKKVRPRGGDVKLVRLVNQPREVFVLLSLDRAFPLFDSLEAAEAAFA